MIEQAVAWAQAKVLHDAGRASPVPHVAYRMNAMANEWARVARLWDDLSRQTPNPERQYVIDLVGSVEPGMVIYDDHLGATKVRRKMERDGQLSLHVDDPDPSNPGDEARGVYLNSVGPSSPIVIKTSPYRAAAREEQASDDQAA